MLKHFISNQRKFKNKALYIFLKISIFPLAKIVDTLLSPGFGPLGVPRNPRVFRYSIQALSLPFS